jgi:hypothetical protein
MILHHWVAPPGFNLGCRLVITLRVGQAISRVPAADFMISIDS